MKAQNRNNLRLSHMDRRGGSLTRTLLLSCSVFVCLGLGAVFAAQCTPEQVLAMLDKGFNKDEVMQLCTGANTPVEPQPGIDPQPKQPPAKDGRTGTPDNMNPFPGIDIDWSGLTKYFEISKVHVEEGWLWFIVEAKWDAVVGVVRATAYDADEIEVESFSSSIKCEPSIVMVSPGDRSRCFLPRNPSGSTIKLRIDTL